MAERIENIIKEILKDSEEMTAIAVAEKMNEMGKQITYDTVNKYLKEMTEEGELKREARGKPWMHYYGLKTD